MSKLCYDRRSVGEVRLGVTHPHPGPKTRFLLRHTVAGWWMWVAIYDERTGLSFTITAGLRQRSHSRIRVPRDSSPSLTVSASRLLQPGGPGFRIYIPPEQGNPVIPSYTTRRATVEVFEPL
jgi:hypothetical protein